MQECLLEYLRLHESEFRQEPRLLFSYCDKKEIELDLALIRDIAVKLGISPIQLFSEWEAWQQSQTEQILLLCDNLTCLSRGAHELKKHWRKHPLFSAVTSEWVKCLGGCSRGPCVSFGGTLHFEMTPAKLDGIFAFDEESSSDA